MTDRRAAVFLDRDGVLIEDRDLLVDPAEICVLEGVPEALVRLHDAGFPLVVVSNQAVVARGLATEAEVDAIHVHLRQLLRRAGAPDLDAIYYCPHHPEATLAAYRVACECRKPRPGLLLQAARQRGLDLSASFLVGDRMTDVAAGARAGCRTVLLRTPQTEAPPIATADPWENPPQPDFTCESLAAAADWILRTP